MTHVQDSTKNNKMKSHIEIIKEKHFQTNETIKKNVCHSLLLECPPFRMYTCVTVWYGVSVT